MKFSIDDTDGSNKYKEIQSIIGKKNAMDVLHIDAAYKSKCKAFLSPDKGDIISKKKELEILLQMKFFHHIVDWPEFIDFVNANK